MQHVIPANWLKTFLRQGYKAIRTGKPLFIAPLLMPFFLQISYGDETKFEQADANREAARARAESQLGYPYVFRDARDRHVDYISLAAQISELSKIIAILAKRDATPTVSPPPSVPLATGLGRPEGANLTRASYGPEGPTIKSVSLIAEYQLLKNGNKRLKLGDVADNGPQITADIITLDGSLVERYQIDKKTGIWTPVNDP
ncbi:hypothetical protein [Sneathiella glossodoripedis]|uniref:hypothetical protein n=1 Tax=Sneathiella glossodoripedis TaxID=418853 RepID=UPI00046EFAEB|nr:hypothetical protein [Sneathiella glossodoripedis]